MARTVNSKSDKVAPDAPPPEETKVFLSYSRRDAATLQRIADALIVHPELQPDFDKAEHDPDKVGAGISADEPWWQRLEQMIAGAEAMVFLVSPHSAASKVCDEEIAYAQRLGKRIIPVLAGAVDFAKLPPKLNSLNIAIDFTESGPGFDAAMAHLIRVLSINAAWLREGRRYTERAADWDRKSRPKGGLLPTGAFEEAEAWAARRPKNEPEPGELFTAWIAASRANIQEQLARERRQIRRARIWQAAAALILVGGFAALAYAGWFLVSEQRAFAKSKSLMLARTAEQFRANGDPRRALLLSILASRETALSPSTDEARTSFVLSAGTLKELVAVQHDDIIGDAVFSDDGTRILTLSYDKTARLWDASSGAQIGPALQHEDSVYGAAYSSDNMRILTWSADKTARLWDAATGTQIGPSLQHDDVVAGATFSEDNARILTWSYDDTAKLWNAVTGSQIGPTLLHERGVLGAKFSKDETQIVTWSGDNIVRIWDAGTGAQIGPNFKHSGGVKGATFSKEKKRILSWSYDGTAHLWDVVTGAHLGPTLQHSAEVNGAAFSKGETTILTWSDDNTARIWSTVGGDEIVPPLQHDGPVNGAAFSIDQARVLTWSDDNTARLWDAATGAQIGPALQHDDIVYSFWGAAPLDANGLAGATFSKDETRILTWGGDHTARLWNAATGAQVGAALQHEGFVNGAAFSNDENRILTWSNVTATIWDVSSAMGEGMNQKAPDEICETQLLGSLATTNTGVRAPFPRLIDEKMVTAAPILRGREGEDVCAAPKRPWWDGPLQWIVTSTGMD